MSEKKNLLSVPESVMSDEDRSKMTFNVYDQTFISRVLDFHYGAIIDEVIGNVISLIDTKYNEQTKSLAQVIMQNHAHHMREIDRLITMINKTDKKANSLMLKFNYQKKEIQKLKKVIEDIHKIKIDLKI